jgi:hypothetical protein
MESSKYVSLRRCAKQKAPAPGKIDIFLYGFGKEKAANHSIRGPSIPK